MIAQGELQKLVFVSLAVLLVGFSSAVVLGTVLGLLTGRYRFINYLSDVHISALYSTPNVALIPLLILWFGLGMESKIIIVFLAAFFPIVVNTQGGVRNVSRGLVEIAQAEGANERQLFRKIIVPASLPFIMTGIRLAVGRAVVGMVVAEMFTAIAGLGGAIVYYSNNFVTDKLFVVVILLALLGVGLTEGVRYLEIKFAPWKETERAS
jgi:NitT/TauT family transport system permease protein